MPQNSPRASASAAPRARFPGSRRRARGGGLPESHRGATSPAGRGRPSRRVAGRGYLNHGVQRGGEVLPELLPDVQQVDLAPGDQDPDESVVVRAGPLHERKGEGRVVPTRRPGARLARVRASGGSESSSAIRTPKSVISRRTEPDVRTGGRGRVCTCLHRVVERLCQVGRDAADGLH